MPLGGLPKNLRTIFPLDMTAVDCVCKAMKQTNKTATNEDKHCLTIPGQEVIKVFSCSAEVGLNSVLLNFKLLINNETVQTT